MGKVFTGASMSIDGYISGPGESGFEHLFDWYGNGDVEVATTHPEIPVHVTQVSADHIREIDEMTGVLVCGRKLFDQTGGWGGIHPMGKPIVVVTHSVPDGWPREGFTFVTDGKIESAIATAKGIAGDDKAVGVNGGTIARQCLDAGLLDEIWVDLVPVLLGGGTPFFASLGTAPVVLDGPLSAVQGNRVTHLRYRVRRPQ